MSNLIRIVHYKQTNIKKIQMKKQSKLEQSISEINCLVDIQEKRLKELKKEKRQKKVMGKDDIAVKDGIIRGLKMALVLCNCNSGKIKPMK